LNKLFEVGVLLLDEAVISCACIRLPNKSAKNRMVIFFTRQIEQKDQSFTTGLTFRLGLLGKK
jgi:hypothetical protein